MTNRINALRKNLANEGCDAFISLTPATNQYLTDFRGSASAILITADEALFLCDFRYTEQARHQVRGYTIREVKGKLGVRLAEAVSERGLSAVGFEPHYLTVDELNALEGAAGKVFKEAPEMVSPLRRRKDAAEVARVRAASELAEGVLRDLLPELRLGITERELAARFEYEFKMRGASGPSFDTIALFGARSSLPHGEPGDRALQEGDIVLLDFGCRREGYCSDLTRTYAFGRMPGQWFQEIYELTLAAQRRAIDAVRPGVSCRDVDAAARDIISEAGHGPHFGHGLGHGVGIEIHEAPRLNPETNAVLEAGMVITIEPGIYVPGQGGVRIEDLIVVTQDGCNVLTRTQKELKILAS